MRPCGYNDAGMTLDDVTARRAPGGFAMLSLASGDANGRVTVTVSSNVYPGNTATGDTAHCGTGYVSVRYVDMRLGSVECRVPIAPDTITMTANGTVWSFDYISLCQPQISQLGEPWGRAFYLAVVPSSHVIANDTVPGPGDAECTFRCDYVALHNDNGQAIISNDVSFNWPMR